MTAYQSVLLTPILAVWVWQHRRRSPLAWSVTLVPLVWIGAWQVFERLSTGAMPAAVLSGYLTIYQTLAAKLGNALMLSILTYSICSFASGLARSIPMLASFRFILGLGMGGEWNTGATLVAETWPTELR